MFSIAFTSIEVESHPTHSTFKSRLSATSNFIAMPCRATAGSPQPPPPSFSLAGASSSGSTSSELSISPSPISSALTPRRSDQSLL